MTFGFAFRSKEFTNNPDDLMLLRGDNVAQGILRWDGVKRFPASRRSEFEPYELARGDVVIAMDRPWISAGLKWSIVREADLPSLLVQRVARLRTKSADLDQRFLAAVIGSQAFSDYVVGVQTGSAVPHISGGQIGDFEFRLPPIEEQQSISSTLNAIDEKIESNKRAEFLINELASDAFQAVVLQNESKLTPLGDITTVVKGRSYKSAELADSTTALVTLKSIDRNGGYKVNGLKPYVGDYKPSQIVAPGEIVVAQTDLTQGAEVVGRGVRVPASPEYETLVASLDLAIVRPADGMPVEYLLGLLTSDDFREWCRSRVTGTTVLHLAKDAIPTWPAPLVSPEKQRAFADDVGVLYQRLDSLAVETAQLIALRDALLPALLSGRIRAADLEGQPA